MIRNVLCLGISFLFVGCASYADLGNGHRGQLETMAVRDAFGTNVVAFRAKHCEKAPGEQQEYSKCRWMTPEEQAQWFPGTSQGVGGQIVGGALTGLGFGLGSAFSGAGNTASSVSNSTTNVITKGGHH